MRKSCDHFSMSETLKEYESLSAEDRRAADMCCRPAFNDRTIREVLEAGVDLSVELLREAVEIGRKLIAGGVTEADVSAAAAAGRVA
jgi:hypothetical protein